MLDLTVEQQEKAVRHAISYWLCDNTELIKEAISTAVENWLFDHAGTISQAIGDAAYQAMRGR